MTEQTTVPPFIHCQACGALHPVGPCPLGQITIWPKHHVDVQSEILAELRKIRELLEKRP